MLGLNLRLRKPKFRKALSRPNSKDLQAEDPKTLAMGFSWSAWLQKEMVTNWDGDKLLLKAEEIGFGEKLFISPLPSIPTATNQ